MRHMVKNWLKCAIKNPECIVYYFHWRRSMREGYSLLEDQFPWIVYQAVLWLCANLKPHMKVFEWGSGGSTLYFAKRVSFIHTVEHDPKWYAEVVKQNDRLGINNIRHVLAEPSAATHIDPMNVSSDGKYRGLSFETYTSQIDCYPDNSFDLVVVDGRSRVGCIYHAIPKVKSGGYLLLDNSDREEYIAGKMLLQEWRKTVFWGPSPCVTFLTETTVWQKPC